MDARFHAYTVVAALGFASAGCGSSVDVPASRPGGQHVWSRAWNPSVPASLSEIHVRPDGRILVSGVESSGPIGDGADSSVWIVFVRELRATIDFGGGPIAPARPYESYLTKLAP